MPIEIEGLADLSAMLTTIAPTAARRATRKALGKGADIVQQAAETAAPVYTGILEECIVQKANFENDDDAGTTTLQVDIGPSKEAFWGSIQEFGSQEVFGTDKTGRKFHHTAQPAQRWMTHSWEACRDQVENVVATELIGMLQDLENKRG